MSHINGKSTTKRSLSEWGLILTLGITLCLIATGMFGTIVLPNGTTITSNGYPGILQIVVGFFLIGAFASFGIAFVSPLFTYRKLSRTNWLGLITLGYFLLGSTVFLVIYYVPKPETPQPPFTLIVQFSPTTTPIVTPTAQVLPTATSANTPTSAPQVLPKVTPTIAPSPQVFPTIEPVLPAKEEELGRWIYQQQRPTMPAPAGPNQIILGHGDLNDSGKCYLKVFYPDQKVQGLGNGSFILVRITGNSDQILASIARIGAGAAAFAHQSECPFLS